jgi:hypothetical protein
VDAINLNSFAWVRVGRENGPAVRLIVVRRGVFTSGKVTDSGNRNEAETGLMERPPGVSSPKLVLAQVSENYWLSAELGIAPKPSRTGTYRRLQRSAELSRRQNAEFGT